jgi:hypothetical protein
VSDDAPVGRREIFETIKARLASPKPGVIVVAGGAGSGRTHLLRQLAATARKLGYRVLIGTDAEPIAIEPTTTMADVRRRLQALHDEGITAVDPAASPAAGPPLAPPSPPIKETIRRGIGWAFSRLDENRETSALFGQLAPLLVAVDGFRPGPTFGLWFTRILIPRLRASDDRVAFVIADGAEAVRSLTDLADLSVSLGPLDADEVRAHLMHAAAGFIPPLTPEEIDRYVTAAVAQPAVLSALSTVFGAYRPARAEVPV